MIILTFPTCIIAIHIGRHRYSGGNLCGSSWKLIDFEIAELRPRQEVMLLQGDRSDLLASALVVASQKLVRPNSFSNLEGLA